MNHAFLERCKKQIEKEVAYTYMLYDKYVSSKKVTFEGKSITLKKFLPMLPHGYLSYESEFAVAMAGDVKRLHTEYGFIHSWCGSFPHIETSSKSPKDVDKLLFPPHLNTYNSLMVLDARSKERTLYESLDAARTDLTEEIESTYQTTVATLDSVTTVQKLIELWPEVEAFAMNYLTPKSAANQMLPVIARKQLNTALGLPPTSKVA